MRLSRFYELVQDEFGPDFAAVVLSDTRLDLLSDKTPQELLAAGEDPRIVWEAICRQLAIPEERWQGKNKSPRHAD
ncbi:MAG: hypothetical protein RL537_423 [Actinomycetota bacterium]